MSDVKARILLWGIEGSGKSTTLATIHEKLRPDLRGEIGYEPTRLDPTVVSETLLIKLGPTAGIDNQIELLAVPGAADQTMSRKQLLDGVDGMILLLDCSPERIGANAPILQELQASLADYGRRLQDIPIVLQYNKRDIADPFAIEELHRQIGLTQAAVFETIATTGHGILSTLTTISKHVVRARKGPAPTTASDPSTPPAQQAAPAAPAYEMLEEAILAEGDDGQTAEWLEPIPTESPVSPSETQPDWDAEAQGPDALEAIPEAALSPSLNVVSVGQARLKADQSVELALVLGDENGQTRSVLLSLRLDALSGDGKD